MKEEKTNEMHRCEVKVYVQKRGVSSTTTSHDHYGLGHVAIELPAFKHWPKRHISFGYDEPKKIGNMQVLSTLFGKALKGKIIYREINNIAGERENKPFTALHYLDIEAMHKKCDDIIKNKKNHKWVILGGLRKAEANCASICYELLEAGGIHKLTSYGTEGSKLASYSVGFLRPLAVFYQGLRYFTTPSGIEELIYYAHKKEEGWDTISQNSQNSII